jgi:hypothetical protein
MALEVAAAGTAGVAVAAGAFCANAVWLSTILSASAESDVNSGRSMA